MKHAMMLLAALLPAAAQDVPSFLWSPTGRLAEGRSSACVAPLQDGRALIAGGEGAAGTLASVEIYGLDGQFTAGPAMNSARSRHTCTTLNDGRVLVVGGGAAAEIYDPAANAWTVLDTPGLGRRGSTATLRPDGTVAIVGGFTDDGASTAVEIFDPASNQISVLSAALASARSSHAAALLPDGGILIVGGRSDSDVLANTEIVLPDGSIVAGPSLAEPRAGASATPLPDGRVLIAGGTDGQVDFATAYLFAPSDGTLQPAGVLNTPRSRHVALALPGNGSILIAGGDSNGVPTATSEVFDLSTGMFQPAGDLTIARRDIAAAALNQPGVVLSVGGVNDSGPLNGCGTFVAPAISFDQRAYRAGDTLQITGAHWPPGLVKGGITLTNLLQAVTGTVTAEVTADATGAFQFTAPSRLSTASAGSNIQATFKGGGFGATASSLQSDPSTTTVTLSAATATAGQPVTITANVREAVGLVSALPGTVNFTLDGAPLGPAATQTFDAAANHLFTFTTPGLKGGAHTIGASYASSSAMFPASSGSAQVQVNRTGSTLTLAATHNVVVGETVQVTINVKPVQTVNLPAPTGTVQLLVNGASHNLTLTPNNLALSSQAVFTFAAPGPPQTINYQASYLGDDNYNPVGPSFNNSIVTSTTVDITMTPSKPSFALGDDVTFMVKIKPHFDVSVSPTGSIQALQSIEQTSFTLAPADANRVSNTLVKFGLLGVGSWSVSIHYSGDATFAAADAQATFQVGKATPPLVMRVQNVTTLNVTSYAAGIKVTDPHYDFQSRYPSGTIKVFYNGSATAAHTFNISENLNQIFDFSYANPDIIVAIPGTTFPIRFVYSGDSNYNSVESTCNAKVDLIADVSHLSCNTYP